MSATASMGGSVVGRDDMSGRTGAVGVVRWPHTPVGGTTVELLEGTDTDVLAQVDVSGNGG